MAIITRYVIGIIDYAGYAGIAALMFIENVFPPIPSEFIMPLAGFMVSQGQFSFAGVVIAGTLGSVLGAIPFYQLGKKMDERKLRALTARYGRWMTVSYHDIERANRWFDRYGGATVLFCRLVPGIRSLISIPAGVNNMNFGAFLFYTAIGSSVWTLALAYVGYLLKSGFTRVEDYLDPISTFIIVALIVIYVVRVIRYRA